MSIFRKKIKIEYDHEKQTPALKTSICTGEKVAGFIDIDTGKFHDHTLITDTQSLIDFCEGCGIQLEDIKKIV